MREGLRLGSWWRPLVVLAAAASSGAAQSTATLAGLVRDSTGRPVPQARLALAGSLALTDTAGRFLFTGLFPGNATLTVRRLGFMPRDVLLELGAGRTDSLIVVLGALAQELAGITSETKSLDRVMLAEFYRHKQSGAGRFFEREQIAKVRVHKMSDFLRRVPGVRIVSDRNGRTFLRMMRASGGRDCPPDYWIDGVRAPFLNVDDIPIQDVEALEVYNGPSGVPVEMNNRFGNPACGAVMIWTRLPG